jgi:hypothetical protein
MHCRRKNVCECDDRRQDGWWITWTSGGRPQAAAGLSMCAFVGYFGWVRNSIIVFVLEIEITVVYPNVNLFILKQ